MAKWELRFIRHKEVIYVVNFFSGLFNNGTTSRAGFSNRGVAIVLPVSNGIVPLRRLPSRAFTSTVLNPNYNIRPANSAICTPFSNAIARIPRDLRTINVVDSSNVRLLVRINVSAIRVGKRNFASLAGRKTGIGTNAPLLGISLRTVHTTNRPATATLVIAGDSSLPRVDIITGNSTTTNAPIFGFGGWIDESPKNEILSKSFYKRGSCLFTGGTMFYTVFSYVTKEIILR